jgi:hypothetical protein
VDVGVEGGGVAAQVVDDLVAVRVALGVAGERQARQAAVAGRGEQGEAVVVVRPGPPGLGSGFEHDRLPAAGEQGVRGGEAGLAGADDDRIRTVHGHL